MKKELLIAALGIGVSGALDAATQQEVERLLAKIAKSPAPKNLLPGACCYEPAGVTDRMEYVCPVCGTKTLYHLSSEESLWKRQSLVDSELNSYRKHCATLRKLGWKVKLDETFLCSKCRKAEQPEELFLEVTIDGKTTRSKLEYGDLEKLVAFAEKKLVWPTNYGATMPLKDELPRIRELLGIPEEKPTEKSK